VTLVEQALATIRRHAMLTGGETVLIAVSGGADSVALAHTLVALAPALALDLRVGHVDHRLRPDSGDDAAFVRTLAGGLGLPVDVVAVDVPREASVENAARRARYAALEALADRAGAERIAVAHTADDQAETVLMRLLQGAGPRGLAGMPAVRGRVVRPLIDARRADVIDSLKTMGLCWRDDPSNADRRFLRNRVRHDLLPALARENASVVEALVRTAQHVRDMVDAIDGLAAAELAGAERDPDGVTLAVDRLRALPLPVAIAVLRQACMRLGGPPALRAADVRALARVVRAGAPRRPVTMGGLRLEVSGRRARIARASRPTITTRTLVVPGVTRLDDLGLELRARLVDADGYDLPRGPRAVAFDADRLPGPLVVRARRRGDRFAPFGGVEGRLKEVLIAARVPRWERDSVPLVDAGGDIVWAAGVRRGRAAPVTPETRRVLELVLATVAAGPADR
jgi:tRNA(Ile)-lysidine synthase